MAHFYCGSNLNLPPNHVPGDRTRCFRKGFGSCLAQGRRGELYSPLNVRDPALPRLYCGKGPLPPGYDRQGHPSECLRKGFGTCLYMNPGGGGPEGLPPPRPWYWFLKNKWFWVVLAAICIIIVLILLIIYLR